MSHSTQYPPKLTKLEYIALIRQSGASNIVNQTSGTLSIGVTYQIITFNVGDDFSNVGLINPGYNYVYFIATGVTPLNWTHGSTLRKNTGAPVVDSYRVLSSGLPTTSLINTFEEVSKEGRSQFHFEYYLPGIYYLQHPGALFTANKTIAEVTNSVQASTTSTIDARRTTDYLIQIRSAGVTDGTPRDSVIGQAGSELNFLKITTYL